MRQIQFGHLEAGAGEKEAKAARELGETDASGIESDARESEDGGRDAKPYTYLPFREPYPRAAVPFYPVYSDPDQE